MTTKGVIFEPKKNYERGQNQLLSNYFLQTNLRKKIAQKSKNMAKKCVFDPKNEQKREQKSKNMTKKEIKNPFKGINEDQNETDTLMQVNKYSNKYQQRIF